MIFESYGAQYLKRIIMYLVTSSYLHDDFYPATHINVGKGKCVCERLSFSV